MGNSEKGTNKLCSFYISDWHLVTMILPYINKELNEEANIVTIFENNIEDNIKTLISKLNLKNENKILKINWKSTNENKKIKISTKLEANKNVKNIIFIKGSLNYINNINDCIDKELNKHKKEYEKLNIKIINCYEVTEFNGNIRNILDNHDKILNTAGEKEISEIFEGYKKVDNVS